MSTPQHQRVASNQLAQHGRTPSSAKMLERKSVTDDSVARAFVKHRRRNSEEIMQQLDQRFFTPEFDAVRFALEKMPPKLEDNYIENQMAELDTMKDIIHGRLTTQVMDNYTAFVQGMEVVRDVELELTMSAILCKNGRRLLHRVDDEMSTSLLQIISKVRRKARLVDLHSTMRNIAKVFSDEKAIQKLLDQNQFASCLEKFKQTTGLAKQLRQYTCLGDVQKRLDSLKTRIDEKIYSELFAFCTKFDAELLESVVKAYAYVHETELLAERLKKRYIESINKICQQAVIAFTPVTDVRMATQLNNMKFKELCGQIARDRYLETMMLIMERLSDLLYSYYRTDLHCAELAKEAKLASAEKLGSLAADVNRNRRLLWREAETRVLTALTDATLTTATIQLDDFLQILNSAYKFVAIGEAFSNQQSFGLRSTIQLKSTEYVENFHRESMELIRQTLEADVWKSIPVANFDLLSIRELRTVLDKRGLILTAANPSTTVGQSLGSSTTALLMQAAGGNPSTLMVGAGSGADDKDALWQAFSQGMNIFRAESEMATKRSSSSTMSESAAQSGLSLISGTASRASRPSAAGTAFKMAVQHPALFTTSSHVLVRYIAKYIHIMQTLSPLSVQALNSIAEIFDFYLYSVFNLFGVASNRFYDDSFGNTLYPRLRSAALAIRDRIEAGFFGKFSLTADIPSSSSPFSQPVFMLLKAGGTQYVQPKTPIVDPSSASAAAAAKASGNLSSEETAAMLAAKKMLASRKNAQKPGQNPATGASAEISAAIAKTGAAMGAVVNAIAGSSVPQLVRLQPSVILNTAQNLFGVVPRLIATESLVFVVHILSQLEHRIALLLPKDQQHRAAKFMTYAQGVVDELRTYMMRNVATLMVKMDVVQIQLSSCKFDLKTISGRASDYMSKVLIKNIEESDALLKQAERKDPGGGLPPHLYETLWKEVMYYVADELLDGYSKVKKCTTEGRSLMQLDVSELKTRAQLITGIKTWPQLDHVIKWIGGYYMFEERDFLNWIEQNPEFTLQQYLAIVAVQPKPSSGGSRTAFQEQVKKAVMALTTKKLEKKEETKVVTPTPGAPAASDPAAAASSVAAPAASAAAAEHSSDTSAAAAPVTLSLDGVQNSASPGSARAASAEPVHSEPAVSSSPDPTHLEPTASPTLKGASPRQPLSARSAGKDTAAVSPAPQADSKPRSPVLSSSPRPASPQAPATDSAIANGLASDDEDDDMDIFVPSSHREENRAAEHKDQPNPFDVTEPQEAAPAESPAPAEQPAAEESKPAEAEKPTEEPAVHHEEIDLT